MKGGGHRGQIDRGRLINEDLIPFDLMLRSILLNGFKAFVCGDDELSLDHVLRGHHIS